MTSAATKTTDTIRYMTAANLAFMLDPMLREAVTPEAGQGIFSPAEFVRDGYFYPGDLGVLDGNGRLALYGRTTDVLSFMGDKVPAAGDVGELHHLAHEGCFIANSIKTQVTVDAAS